MSTLARRATPRQAMVMRMIEGACRATAHAHPGKTLDERLARSIAKRAAGTLTSQWRRVLSEPRARSEGESRELGGSTANGVSRLQPDAVGEAVSAGPTRLRGASQLEWRTPLHRIKGAIGEAAGKARREGRTEREEALTDVLRLLSEVMLADKPPSRRERLKVGKRDQP